MSNDQDLRKVNEIVGEALKALVDSGVPVEFVGSFATTYPAKVAQIMGSPGKPVASMDLEQLIQATVARTVETVVAGRPRKLREHTVTKVNVTVHGKRTTVTLGKELLASLASVCGSPRKATEIVRRCAQDAPLNVENRSAWMAEKLQGYLSHDSLSLASARPH